MPKNLEHRYSNVCDELRRVYSKTGQQRTRRLQATSKRLVKLVDRLHKLGRL